MSWLSDLFKKPSDIVRGYLEAGFLQASIEAKLDAMNFGDTEVIDAPAPLLIRDVVKRGNARYDVVGYAIRKRAK